MAAYARKKGIPEDVSPLILEYHARRLGMSVDELIDRIAQISGKSTAEKLRKLYDELRAQRQTQRKTIVFPVLYASQITETKVPGNYRMRALILPPDAEEPKWATFFGDSGILGKIAGAPLGAMVEVPVTGFQYDEEYDSYTIRWVRNVFPPNKDVLDVVAKLPTKDLFDSLTDTEVVVLKLNTGDFDVDNTYTETQSGNKVVRLLGKLGDTDLLAINIYDVSNIPASDPWVEIKDFPVIYVSGRFRGVRGGIYVFNASKVFVPTGTEEPLEARIINYMRRKGRKELSPRALARALKYSEAEIIAAARSSDKLEYDEEADVVILKE